jgi:hypothetical protein
VTPEEIYNERLKQLAAFLHNIAVALVAAGVFGPIFAWIYGLMNIDPLLVFLSMVGCFVASLTINYVAHSILGELQ